MEVRKRFRTRFSDPVLVQEFEEIVQEVDTLREQRNPMLHSVWLATSDPEKPFVRVKEDERDPEVDFDVPAVEKLVDRMTDCRDRAYDFFCEKVPGYPELPARLYGSLP